MLLVFDMKLVVAPLRSDNLLQLSIATIIIIVILILILIPVIVLDSFSVVLEGSCFLRPPIVAPLNFSVPMVVLVLVVGIATTWCMGEDWLLSGRLPQEAAVFVHHEGAIDVQSPIDWALRQAIVKGVSALEVAATMVVITITTGKLLIIMVLVWAIVTD